MSVYLWIGLASIALILVSVLASLRKYLAAVSLVGASLPVRSGIFYLTKAISRKILPKRKNRITIQVTIDGDTLKLTNATSEQQRKVIEAFIARHSNSSNEGSAE